MNSRGPISPETLSHWRPQVTRWCRRFGVPAADVDDVTQDVMLVAMRRWHDLEQPERLRSWLYGITKRIAGQYRRGSWRLRRAVHEEITHVVDLRPGPESSYLQYERRRKIDEMLNELPLQQRVVIAACVVEARSVREVSRQLGLPQGTVASRLRLAKRRLRAIAHARGLRAD